MLCIWAFACTFISAHMVPEVDVEYSAIKITNDCELPNGFLELRLRHVEEWGLFLTSKPTLFSQIS